MRPRPAARWLFASSLFLPWSTACKNREDASDVKLIGGQVDEDGRFPSAVKIAVGCTATIVAPRALLTAAHCVMDSEPVGHDPKTMRTLIQHRMMPKYEAGGKIRLTNAKVTADGAPFVDITVRDTEVNPAWRKLCDRPCDWQGALPLVPDVAVILTQEDIPAALRAADPKASANLVTPVSFAPVVPGDKVSIVGYGCEDGRNFGPPGEKEFRKKFQDTRAVGPDDVGDFLYVRQERAATYVFTPGMRLKQDQASLCTGDSGGPLFAEENGAWAVVGVNSQSYWKAGTSKEGIAEVNLHTRLDRAAPMGVGSWLKGVLDQEGSAVGQR